MSDKGNEKRSLLVNLSNKSNGYDTNSVVTSLSPNSFSLPTTATSNLINHPHPVTLDLNKSLAYSKMQKKRAAPPRPNHQKQQNNDDDSNKIFLKSIK